MTKSFSWEKDINETLLSCVGSHDPCPLQKALLSLVRQASVCMDQCVEERKFQMAKRLCTTLRYFLAHIEIRKAHIHIDTSRPSLVDLTAAVLSIMLDLQIFLTEWPKKPLAKDIAAAQIIQDVLLFMGSGTFYLWDTLLQSTALKKKKDKEVGSSVLQRLIEESPWNRNLEPESYLKCLLCMRLWYLHSNKEQKGKIRTQALSMCVPKHLPRWLKSHHIPNIPSLAKKEPHKNFVKPFLKRLDPAAADALCEALSEDIMEYDSVLSSETNASAIFSPQKIEPQHELEQCESVSLFTVDRIGLSTADKLFQQINSDIAEIPEQSVDLQKRTTYVEHDSEASLSECESMSLDAESTLNLVPNDSDSESEGGLQYKNEIRGNSSRNLMESSARRNRNEPKENLNRVPEDSDSESDLLHSNEVRGNTSRSLMESSITRNRKKIKGLEHDSKSVSSGSVSDDEFSFNDSKMSRDIDYVSSDSMAETSQKGNLENKMAEDSTEDESITNIMSNEAKRRRKRRHSLSKLKDFVNLDADSSDDHTTVHLDESLQSIDDSYTKKKKLHKTSSKMDAIRTQIENKSQTNNLALDNKVQRSVKNEKSKNQNIVSTSENMNISPKKPSTPLNFNAVLSKSIAEYNPLEMEQQSSGRKIKPTLTISKQYSKNDDMNMRSNKPSTPLNLNAVFSKRIAEDNQSEIEHQSSQQKIKPTLIISKQYSKNDELENDHEHSFDESDSRETLLIDCSTSCNMSFSETVELVSNDQHQSNTEDLSKILRRRSTCSETSYTSLDKLFLADAVCQTSLSDEERGGLTDFETILIPRKLTTKKEHISENESNVDGSQEIFFTQLDPLPRVLECENSSEEFLSPQTTPESSLAGSTKDTAITNTTFSGKFTRIISPQRSTHNTPLKSSPVIKLENAIGTPQKLQATPSKASLLDPTSPKVSTTPSKTLTASTPNASPKTLSTTLSSSNLNSCNSKSPQDTRQSSKTYCEVSIPKLSHSSSKHLRNSSNVSISDRNTLSTSESPRLKLDSDSSICSVHETSVNQLKVSKTRLKPNQRKLEHINKGSTSPVKNNTTSQVAEHSARNGDQKEDVSVVEIEPYRLRPRKDNSKTKEACSSKPNTSKPKEVEKTKPLIQNDDKQTTISAQLQTGDEDVTQEATFTNSPTQETLSSPVKRHLAIQEMKKVNSDIDTYLENIVKPDAIMTEDYGGRISRCSVELERIDTPKENLAFSIDSDSDADSVATMPNTSRHKSSIESLAKWNSNRTSNSFSNNLETSFSTPKVKYSGVYGNSDCEDRTPRGTQNRRESVSSIISWPEKTEPLDKKLTPTSEVACQTVLHSRHIAMLVPSIKSRRKTVTPSRKLLTPKTTVTRSTRKKSSTKSSQENDRRSTSPQQTERVTRSLSKASLRATRSQKVFTRILDMSPTKVKEISSPSKRHEHVISPSKKMLTEELASPSQKHSQELVISPSKKQVVEEIASPTKKEPFSTAYVLRSNRKMQRK